MRTLVKLALLALTSLTIFGCAHNYYSIPQETLEKKVRVIGVAPFLVDAESDIRHPEKSALISMIQSYNSKNEKEFIGRLRDTGIYYAVRQVDADPVRLLSTLLANRERRDDAGVIYNKYFYKTEELKKLMAANGLDAILLVTVNGLTRPEKVYASNFLSYLDTDYNYLAISAELLDRDGSVIWEYPNFRRSALSYPLFFRLQYPDFDEAAANLSEKVQVKFKSIPGIGSALAKTEGSKVSKEQLVSSLYADQYDEMISLLKTYRPLLDLNAQPPAPAPLLPAPAPMTPAAEAPALAEPTPAKAPSSYLPAAPGAVPAPASAGSIPSRTPATPPPAPTAAPAKGPGPAAQAIDAAEPAAKPAPARQAATLQPAATAPRQAYKDAGQLNVDTVPLAEIVPEEPPVK